MLKLKRAQEKGWAGGVCVSAAGVCDVLACALLCPSGCESGGARGSGMCADEDDRTAAVTVEVKLGMC